MQHKRTKAAPRTPPVKADTKVQESLSSSVQFGYRADDWLVLGDWLAAGEKIKAHPLKQESR